MFENLIKQKPHLANSINDAVNAIKDLAEPHKTKIMNGFKTLEKVSFSMEEYKELDALMDDSASDLTMLSNVDVRKDGLHKALSKVIHSTDQARAIIDACNWLIAKAMKEYIDNE